MTKRNKTALGIVLVILLLAGAVMTPISGAGAVREQIAIYAKSANSFIANGYDLIFYSDDLSTQTLSLDSATGDIDSEGTLDVPVVMVDGATDVVQLTAQGSTTQTADILVVENSAGDDKFAVSTDGHVEITVAGVDADTTSYDEWVHIEGVMAGTGTKDRNYGLVIEMTREAGSELDSGDHDEAGLKIRVDTEAVTTTAGTVLRGADIEAKADNPDGTVTNLYGVSATAKSDTSAGDVGTMVALYGNTQNNAAVDDFLAAADLRIMRQSATEPTEEYALYVRSDSTTGTGADAAIYVESNYAASATTDAFDYGIDFSAAAINTADIRLENGETISNETDGDVLITATDMGVVGQLNDAVITVPSIVGDVFTITVQFNDIAGTALATTAGCMWYLSEDAAGAAIANGAPSGGIAISTDGLLLEWTADLSGWMVSEADGDVDFTIEDNGADTMYLVLVMPDGRLVVSSIINWAS